MDNKKIGKLIADLRKQKGMTQQELGDKIGVGFRAVSKWERGLTLPDIGNINELSKILGITSDELLKGELNKENKIKKKPSSKIIKITISIISIIILITTFIIYQNNKTYAYSIENATDEYYVDGKLIFNEDNISIIVNKIDFKDVKFSSTIIQNYEYEIKCNNEHIVKQGYVPYISLMDTPISINEFTKKLTINYNAKTKLEKAKILKNGIKIDFIFLDENNNKIKKEIKLTLSENAEK